MPGRPNQRSGPFKFLLKRRKFCHTLHPYGALWLRSQPDNSGEIIICSPLPSRDMLTRINILGTANKPQQTCVYSVVCLIVHKPILSY